MLHEANKSPWFPMICPKFCNKWSLAFWVIFFRSDFQLFSVIPKYLAALTKGIGVPVWDFVEFIRHNFPSTISVVDWCPNSSDLPLIISTKSSAYSYVSTSCHGRVWCDKRLMCVVEHLKNSYMNVISKCFNWNTPKN